MLLGKPAREPGHRVQVRLDRPRRPALVVEFARVPRHPIGVDVGRHGEPGEVRNLPDEAKGRGHVLLRPVRRAQLRLVITQVVGHGPLRLLGHGLKRRVDHPIPP